ncbi:hypothetical protein [Rhodococcus erythropolis]|uniref:hypothetical protein n=1 Tax=Rhodococcus erythropolis TaxID=1833 RepID=UPI001BE621B4|nr:hypothetical protein [Rhodococcus erythropolis]MBT2266001.1 hypothetical protein [Rhodococcus erythropolis]
MNDHRDETTAHPVRNRATDAHDPPTAIPCSRRIAIPDDSSTRRPPRAGIGTRAPPHAHTAPTINTTRLLPGVALGETGHTSDQPET